MVTLRLPQLFQGTVYSDSTEWPAGMTKADAVGLLSDADRVNPDTRIEICIERSTDGGFVFEAGAKSQFAGSPTPNPITGGLVFPEIQDGWSPPALPPTHMRIRLSSPAPVSCGAGVTFMA